MRIFLIGGGSFIARAVRDACQPFSIDCISLRHDEAPGDAIQKDDCVINFAIDPRYHSGPYSEDYDCDVRAALAASEKQANFIMLSTRRVYGPRARWNAVESCATSGDETPYGRNKATSESAVQKVCQGRASIFRLSNIFGYEYKPAAPRKSFLGQLLFTLKHQRKIIFDMHRSTQRDFLPVEICAQLLVARAVDKTTGIYNLGGGFAIDCGALAEWVMEGFGDGELIYDTDGVRDEFFLSMDKWRQHFDLPIDVQILRNYCVELGKRLRCERF